MFKAFWHAYLSSLPSATASYANSSLEQKHDGAVSLAPQLLYCFESTTHRFVPTSSIQCTVVAHEMLLLALLFWSVNIFQIPIRSFSSNYVQLLPVLHYTHVFSSLVNFKSTSPNCMPSRPKFESSTNASIYPNQELSCFEMCIQQYRICEYGDGVSVQRVCLESTTLTILVHLHMRNGMSTIATDRCQLRGDW